MKYYLIDTSIKFNGSITSSVTKSGSKLLVDYSGYLHNNKGDDLTLEEYQKLFPDKKFIVVDTDELYKNYIQPYCEGLQGPWSEISESRYNDLLECLPPVHWTTIQNIEFFFISEATTFTIHTCALWDKSKKKYFEALRDIHMKPAEILRNYQEYEKSNR